MAIVIMQDPGNVSAVHGTKEPIVIRVRGTEYVLQAPGQSLNNTTFLTLPAVGNTILVSFANQPTTITFVANGGSRTPRTQCFAAAAGETVADFLNNKFIPVLRENPIFDGCEYSVSGPSSILSIQTVEQAAASITLSATGFNIQSSNQVANVGEFRADYFIRMMIHCTLTQQGSRYSLRSPWLYFKPTLDPNNQAVVEQDISRLIEEIIPGDDLWSESDASAALAVDSVRKCFVKIQEYYPDSLGTSAHTVTRNWRVLKGGRESFARPFPITTTHGRKFLTNRDNVFTDIRMIDWLHFIVPAKASPENIFRVSLEVVSFYGSLTQFYPDITIPNAETGAIVKIPAGYKQMDAHEEVPDPKRYTVSIQEVTPLNNVVIEVCKITFNIMPESDYVSSLQYYNSFGLLESILLNGSVVAVREWARKFEYVDMPLNPKKEDHPELAYDIMQDLSFECVTGPLSKQSWSAAGDVMLSHKHYWTDIVNKNNRHAVVLEKGKAEIGAYNPDGSGYSVVPMKLRFPVTKVNSIASDILDI